jgi:trk system potassium uptake protein TrkH
VVEAILLKIGGMGYFDAINHALTTLASGGFSTKQQSIAYFQTPFIQYVIIIFMAIAGTNFTLIYFVIKGKLKKVFSNEEFKYYMLLIAIFTLIGFSTLATITNDNLELAFRNSLFQVVSIITTTGYTIADYTSWGTLLTFLFFIMMFIGASAGSTAGGVKIVRHVILFKNSFLEMKRLLHPSAIIPVRFNNKAISQNITFNILAFIMIYILVFTIGALTMSLIGLDFTTAVGSVASTLGNVGPGIGNVSPSYSFSAIPTVGKWFLAFLMLLGRLELFTIMMLLTPYFWRKL